MKKYFYLAAIAIGLSSCYTTTYTMGSGAQTGVTVTEKNLFLVSGLVALKTADPQDMAYFSSIPFRQSSLVRDPFRPMSKTTEYLEAH